jgi:hypothetical protein
MSNKESLLVPSNDFSVQELFYDQVHSSLDEKGFYYFRTSKIVLVRMGDHLLGNSQTLTEVQKEVSQTYFNKKFKNADTYINNY